MKRVSSISSIKSPDAANFAFIAVCMVNLVDIMGISFTGPALVPYGQSIGATSTEIALFQTMRFLFGIVSMLWMPMLADRRGVKLCIIISIIGTGVGYVVQGLSHEFVDCRATVHTVAAGARHSLPAVDTCVATSGNVTFVGAEGSASAYALAVGGPATLECNRPCGRGGVIAMLVGRSISGFFGGTQPVLRAFVAELSLPNFSLLRFRLTMLFASSQAGNFALAPIAGLIIRWGLHLPWLVSAGITLFVLVFACFSLKSAREIKAMQERKARGETESQAGAGQSNAPKTVEAKRAVYNGPPPWKDKVLWILLFGYILLFSCVSSMMLMIPWLLEYPDYGLVDDLSVDNTQKNIAQGTSLVMVPFGITNLAFSTIGFLLVSARIGDMNCARLGACGSSLMFSLLGFCTNAFWQVCLLHGLNGVFIGLFVPAISPTVQKYNGTAHSERKAQASAFPMLGLQLGFVIGPMVFDAICGGERNRFRMNIAWLSAGVFFFAGFLCFEFAFALIARHPVSKTSKMSAEQIRIKLSTNAEDVEKFVDSMCDMLRLMLTEGNPEFRNLRLWSGHAQRFVRRIISESIPRLPPYDETGFNQDYLEQVAAWLSRAGNDEEIRYFSEIFPHIPVPRGTDSITGGLFGGGQLDAQEPIIASRDNSRELHQRTCAESSAAPKHSDPDGGVEV